MDLLHFIFSDGWHFFGNILILIILCELIQGIFRK
jgi:hypothetical protein